MLWAHIKQRQSDVPSLIVNGLDFTHTVYSGRLKQMASKCALQPTGTVVAWRRLITLYVCNRFGEHLFL